MSSVSDFYISSQYVFYEMAQLLDGLLTFDKLDKC